jgi:hypothetical protein
MALLFFTDDGDDGDSGDDGSGLLGGGCDGEGGGRAGVGEGGGRAVVGEGGGRAGSGEGSGGVVDGCVSVPVCRYGGGCDGGGSRDGTGVRRRCGGGGPVPAPVPPVPPVFAAAVGGVVAAAPAGGTSADNAPTDIEGAAEGSGVPKLVPATTESMGGGGDMRANLAATEDSALSTWAEWFALASRVCAARDIGTVAASSDVVSIALVRMRSANIKIEVAAHRRQFPQEVSFFFLFRTSLDISTWPSIFSSTLDSFDSSAWALPSFRAFPIGWWSVA